MQRNALVTISDNKIGVDAGTDNTADFYEARVLSATDYYAFGMSMKERSWQSESYRYGFNGKENDSDWEVQDYGFRIYKPEIAKFLSVDLLTQSYPWYTPYQFAGNRPIVAIDLDGLEPYDIHHFSMPFLDFEANSPVNPDLLFGQKGVEGIPLDIRLKNGTSARIYKITKVHDKEINKKTKQFTSNCMGYVFTKGEYYITEGMPFVWLLLQERGKASLEEVQLPLKNKNYKVEEPKNIMVGAIVVFLSMRDDGEYSVEHTAVYIGNGKYTTKNGGMPIQEQTLQQMYNTHDEEKTYGQRTDLIGFIKSPNQQKEEKQPQNVPVTFPKKVVDFLINIFKFVLGRKIPIAR